MESDSTFWSQFLEVQATEEMVNDDCLQADLTPISDEERACADEADKWLDAHASLLLRRNHHYVLSC